MNKTMRKSNTKLTRSSFIMLGSVITALSMSACDNMPKKQNDVADNKAIAKEDNVPNFWPQIKPALAPDKALESKVASMLATMTLSQKVAQMIQPEIKDITPEDMRKYGFGSYLNGGGSFPDNNKNSTPQDWIALAEAMYQASIDDSLDGSRIPTMWGTDAVHGHNNVIGATLFPHNIGLGAANNPALIEKIAAITATEVMVTGIDWVFAPTVAVVQDDRWGRTYEGYSEDPAIVRRYSAAIVEGLQGKPQQDFLSDQRVISTVKHFLGDGGTVNGDDQGDNISTEKQLFDIHAQGYVGGLGAGAQSVMASFNSWHGVKNHGNKYLLTDILKTRMGFDGFVVGDWNGHGQVKGCSNESCPQAVNAGLDIFMVPTDAWKPLYENTIKQVNEGVIPMSRIDDAVARILRVKLRAGLFEKPSPAKRKLSGKTELIGQQSHRDVARQAVKESLVLLKNNHQLLPLAPNQRILVAGDGADNIGKQSGGWSITWQGTGNSNDEFPGGTSIYAGISKQVSAAGGTAILSEDGRYTTKPDVAIVVFGEEPYAEGHGDIDNLEFQRGNKSALRLLKKLKADDIPVVSVFISGRPMWLNAELNSSDAFVAAWLPGSEGDGVAEVLLRKASGEINADFTGKLSFSWPATANQAVLNHYDKNYQPLFPFGYGLTYQDNISYANDLDETIAQQNTALATLDIFSGVAKQPWRFKLLSGSNERLVNSSVLTLGAVTLSTEDKDIQEDARRVDFNGSELATLQLNSNFPEDLRAYQEENSTLSFSVKANTQPSSDIWLAMVCEEDCQNKIALNEQLAKSGIGQWQSVSIDLQCFKAKGANLARIISPFSLSTKGSASISIANIKLTPYAVEKATLKCQP